MARFRSENRAAPVQPSRHRSPTRLELTLINLIWIMSHKVQLA